MAGSGHVASAAGAAPVRTRRYDAGKIRLSQRDIDGLLLCAEHYAAPLDLLADALSIRPGQQLDDVIRRWSRAELVTTEWLGHGPKWCWLTRTGMAATGLGFPAGRPALARLPHIRAILAARLWLTAGPAWAAGQAWWHSERRLLAEQPKKRGVHLADAEIHWPDIDGSPYGGQVWAVEVELTPKRKERTSQIMTQMLAEEQYATVVYLIAPRARSAVMHAVTSLPAADQARVAVRDLPAIALRPALTR